MCDEGIKAVATVAAMSPKNFVHVGWTLLGSEFVIR